MKQNRIILCSALSLLMAGSCSDHDEVTNELPLEPQELTGFRVVAPAFEFDDKDSRLQVDMDGAGFAVKWNGKDTLGIMPSEGAQAPFPLNMVGEVLSSTANFTGGGWALLPSVTYSAYYPYIGDIYLDKNNIPVSYLGQWQQHNADYNNIASYIYMAANAVVPKEGVANFQLKHVGCYTLMEIHTPEPTALSSLLLVVDEPLFVHRGRLNMASPNLVLEPQVKSDTIAFNLEGVETTSEQLTAQLCFMFAPTNLEGKKVKAVLRDADGYEEDIEFAGKNLEAGKAYKFDGLEYVVYTQHEQPAWKYDETQNQFQSGMTAVVTVPKSMKKFVGEGDEMSAYVNGELRGVGKLINNAFYLMVHGDIGENGEVSFQYYNKKKQYLYAAENVVKFNSDMAFGVTDEPEELPLRLMK